MTKGFEWSKEVYERSVSSRCWDYTPYDEGWDKCKDIAADDELRQIVGMELELGAVPEWAEQVVERCIDSAQPCGHYLFPQGFLETLSAIGSQISPKMVHSCFTVERERKGQAMDYCLCLDAWLAGEPPEVVARELVALGHRKSDWHSVCRDLWEVLGERTERKELLLEQTLYGIRHAVKSNVWDDDLASEYCRDQYLGEYATNAGFGRYGNPELVTHGFREGASPRMLKVEARLSEILPKEQRPDPPYWWLCAPKAFRFLERRLWQIGKGRRIVEGEEVPGFLRCEDTYPDQDEAAKWWKAFCSALMAWWQGKPEGGEDAGEVNARLGESGPVKRWLVRLFLLKLRLLEAHGEIVRLVNPKPGVKRGTRPIVS